MPGCTKLKRDACWALPEKCHWDGRCKNGAEDDLPIALVAMRRAKARRKANRNVVKDLRDHVKDAENKVAQRDAEAKMAKEVARQSSAESKKLSKQVSELKAESKAAGKEVAASKKAEAKLRKQGREAGVAAKVAVSEAKKAAVAKQKRAERMAKMRAKREAKKQRELESKAEAQRKLQEKLKREKEARLREARELEERRRQERERARAAELRRRELEEEKRAAQTEVAAGEEALVATEIEVLNYFMDCYRKGSGSYNFMPTRTDAEVGPADVQVIEKRSTTSHKMFYGLSGKMLLLPEVRRLIPANHSVDKNGRVSNGKPRFMAKMYIYQHNSRNRASLGKLWAAAKATNAKYGGRRVVREDAPYLTRPRANGILGWDVPCDLPAWMLELGLMQRQWDPKLNPSVQGRVFRFEKCAIPIQAIEGSLEYLSSHVPERFGGVFPKQIAFYTKKGKNLIVDKTVGANRVMGKVLVENKRNNHLYTFLMNDRYTSAQVAWTGHARFMYKDAALKKLYVYDPWMQRVGSGGRGTKGFKLIKDYVEEMGFTIDFIPRSAEQGHEGSCQALAMLRVLLVGEYGVAGATMPVPCEYVVLASRLISHYRGGGRTQRRVQKK